MADLDVVSVNTGRLKYLCSDLPKKQWDLPYFNEALALVSKETSVKRGEYLLINKEDDDDPTDPDVIKLAKEMDEDAKPGEFKPQWLFRLNDDAQDIKFKPSDVLHEDKHWDRLMKNAKPSMVGKNEETVMDEGVRKSHELDAATQLIFNKHYKHMLLEKMRKLATKMGHPSPDQLTLHPHKMLLYGKGCFFEEHMDNAHTEGQVMTMVVQLGCEVPHGGYKPYESNLVVDGSCMGKGYCRNRDDQFAIHACDLFYIDVPHRRPETLGRLITMTFDVCGPSAGDSRQNTLAAKDLFARGVRSLKMRDATRIGIVTRHFYVGEIEAHKLRGMDYNVYRLMLENDDVETIECVQALDYNVHWEHEKQDGFDRLYCEVINPHHPHSEDEHEDSSGNPLTDDSDAQSDSSERIREAKKRRTDYDHVAIAEKYDHVHISTSDDMPMYRDEICYGDVIMIKGQGKRYNMYKGDEELHLGNEGVYGEFKGCHVLVATLKSKD